jgi:two-component system, OmpR family, response regulator
MKVGTMQHTILVVDDDPHIRQLLVFALTKAGYGTIEADNGEAALRQVATHSPNLVVLDITMPSMDGLEVCRRLRAQGDLPILFLSSRDDEIDRVIGIELGADDYVVKPFSPREIVARVGGILRRVDGRNPRAAEATAHIGEGGQIRYSGVGLNINNWTANWQDIPIAVTPTEFTLLRTLMEAPGRVFSRDQLIDRLHRPGFAVSDRTIDSHVRNLRRKFAEAGCEDVIETRPAIGYSIGACAPKSL